MIVGDAATVLADLSRFCYAAQPQIARSPFTGAIDPLETVVRAARLEVFDRIRGFVHISDDVLFNLRDDEP